MLVCVCSNVFTKSVDIFLTCLLLLIISPALPLGKAPSSLLHASICSSPRYAPLYSRIEQDLRHWSLDARGIPEALMQEALRTRSLNKPGQKGLGILFEAGIPYVISNLTALEKLGHHAGLFTAHLMLFQALGRLFGRAIPDVEFVVGTFDVPEIRLDRVPPGKQPVPLLRFCSTPYHADIPVPDIHFQMRRFNATLLSQLGAINAKHPWEERREVLFGRFSGYKRIIDDGLPGLTRKGAEGANICQVAAQDLLFCDVRVHMMKWAAEHRRHNRTLDVARQPRVQMLDHAKYKYLLHLDGQSCSSRLEQLLIMGSLVFKEESGYHCFFHHLLRPHEHYVPVWREGPEDVLSALAWAKANDGQAREIAQRAQGVAAEYLHTQALACYWFTLLSRLAALLRYKPGRQSRQYDAVVPVSDYLVSKQGRRWIEKHGLDRDMELPRMENMGFGGMPVDAG